MRLGGAAIVVCATLASCSVSPSTSVNVSPSPAQTLAADLRTHLDLLLAEHVIVLAKESAAAVNHADDYDEYASLLAATASDLGGVFGSAFGNTTSTDLVKRWNAQDGYLVDYTIGVVTHDDAKAQVAMLTLAHEFVPQFAQALGAASGADVASMTAMLYEEVLADKAFIDDYFAQHYPSFYAGVVTAFAMTQNLGDTLAAAIAQRYPDKFPGDPLHTDVNRRVTLNLLLESHAYVATMATDAVVAGRAAEVSQAAATLSVIATELAALFASGFAGVWAARDSGLVAYARGDSSAKAPLTIDFVKNFATLARVDRSPVSRQLMDTLKVIDDQRAKDSKDVAADDRSAATAMQPIADAASQ